MLMWLKLKLTPKGDFCEVSVTVFFFFANFFMHNPERYLNEHVELISVPNNRSETKICKRRAPTSLLYGSPPGEADHHLLDMIFHKVNDYHLLRVLALLHLVRWMTGLMVRSNSPFTVQYYRPMLANTRQSRIPFHAFWIPGAGF